MSILVTGGSGFIGSHIVDKLIEKGKKVRVFDIKRSHRKDVEFVKGDIRSSNDLKKAMVDVDFIYHIAAFSNIDKIAKDPLNGIDLNIMSTVKVLEAARNSQVERVIFASTYFADSGMGHIYTTTKIASERICKDYYALYGLPFTILRYGTTYGPRSRGEDVISIFVKKALSHKPLTIFGDGTQSRNFIYVGDLADGNVAALKNNAKNKTYTLEGMRQITIKEIVETVKKLIGDVKIDYQKKRLKDFEGKNVLVKETKKELGWEPKVNFEEGVRKYIDWFKENR